MSVDQRTNPSIVRALTDRFRKTPLIPRVTLPGVAPEKRAELAAERDVLRRNRIGMLSALYLLTPAPYEGSVPGHVKAKRRARGKVAKASRKLNRGTR